MCITVFLHPTFSDSVMLSVGMSAFGTTNVHFVEHGVKVNDKYSYYRDVLLMRDLLPDIREMGDFIYSSSTVH